MRVLASWLARRSMPMGCRPLDASRAGMASAVVNALRQVGQAFGVAVLGALVYAHLPEDATAGRLDPAHASPFVGGLHDALWVSGLALLAGGCPAHLHLSWASPCFGSGSLAAPCEWVMAFLVPAPGTFSASSSQ